MKMWMNSLGQRLRTLTNTPIGCFYGICWKYRAWETGAIQHLRVSKEEKVLWDIFLPHTMSCFYGIRWKIKSWKTGAIQHLGVAMEEKVLGHLHASHQGAASFAYFERSGYGKFVLSITVKLLERGGESSLGHLHASRQWATSTAFNEISLHGKIWLLVALKLLRRRKFYGTCMPQINELLLWHWMNDHGMDRWCYPWPWSC